jgi:hypothetical protein
MGACSSTPEAAATRPLRDPEALSSSALAAADVASEAAPARGCCRAVVIVPIVLLALGALGGGAYYLTLPSTATATTCEAQDFGCLSTLPQTSTGWT